ncbi:MAG: tRNA (adenosine(37)-N6)-dimethylallyltransferase MiaA, partial [Kiritimatiellia bacterium]
SPTARHAIGYEEAAAVLDGRLTEETAIRQVTTRTRQYAKRQMTWFRNQADVRWVEVTPRDDTERLANKVRQIWSALGPTRLCP